MENLPRLSGVSRAPILSGRARHQKHSSLKAGRTVLSGWSLKFENQYSKIENRESPRLTWFSLRLLPQVRESQSRNSKVGQKSCLERTRPDERKGPRISGGLGPEASRLPRRASLSRNAGLELVAQGELHSARPAHDGIVIAKRALASNVGRERGGVEIDRVGQVERLPAEHQAMAFPGHAELLGQAEIQVDVLVGAKDVALTAQT